MATRGFENFTAIDAMKHNARVNRPSPALPLSVEEAKQHGFTAHRPRKYRNTKTRVVFPSHGEIVNGHLRLVHEFDSKAEADFYAECAIRRSAGEIRDLRLQEPFALIAQAKDGTPRLVGEYYADAVFFDITADRERVCDVKRKITATALYKLKRKIVEACHGISIEEIA